MPFAQIFHVEPRQGLKRTQTLSHRVDSPAHADAPPTTHINIQSGTPQLCLDSLNHITVVLASPVASNNQLQVLGI